MYELVEIYRDPITRTKLEGRGYLIELLSTTDEMEYWRVKFEGDDECVNRHILRG